MTDMLDALLVAGSGVLLAGLGAAAARGGPEAGSLDAAKLVPGLDWRTCWVNFTPDAYVEMLQRVALRGAVDNRSIESAARGAYRDMERLRDEYLARPGSLTSFEPGFSYRYRDMHLTVKHGDTSVLDERERGYLRMFLDAARTYYTIADRVKDPGDYEVSVADLAKVVCVDETRVREDAERRLQELIEMADNSLESELQRYGVASLDELVGLKQRNKHLHNKAVQAASSALAVRDACYDQLQLLRLRGKRTLVLGSPS